MYKIIGVDGKEYGPVSGEQLRQWLAEGRVNDHTQVQGQGETEWRPLSAFPEFTASTEAPPVSSTSPAPVPQAATTVHPATIQPRPKIPSYLVQSILCTLFCCLPFGIPAIVFASRVNNKIATGDIDGAQEDSKKAKMWCWISFGLGLVIFVFYAVMMAIGLFSGIVH